MAHALVTYWLPYGNVFLCGLPSTLMKGLRKLQNSTTRPIARARKLEHITPALNRSLYKILVCAYKTLHRNALQHLDELVVSQHPTRSLRSEFKARGVTYGKIFSGKAAATIWDNFPLNIRKCKTRDAFKKRVKANLRVIFLRLYRDLYKFCMLLL